jgi:crotonobetainyl-CoA:carnitine CoA-transferase CaiB-like acyl-CoA transferase
MKRNTDHNIFSGLKVVDFASFIAGPGAAVMLADFDADVIKVEPPTGDMQRVIVKVPPQPRAEENYPWQLDNRNKRGLALDLKSAGAAQVLERLVKWADVLIVNFPQSVRKKLKLTYADVSPWNPRLVYADLTGYGDEGPDAELPGFDITAFWARSGLLAMTRDAGAPPTLPIAGSGDHATAVSIYGAIVTALYRREKTGKGSYVTTSLLASGIWSAGIAIQGALCDAQFYPLHDRKNPANAAFNVYRSSDDSWFLIVTEPARWPGLAKAVDREDLLKDPRFAEPEAQMKNAAALTAILDEAFGAKPIAHWRQALLQGRVPFGVVQTPGEVVRDPQLEANGIVVPIEGGTGRLTRTIASPIQVHGVAKVPARLAPGIGEDSDDVLQELGFSPKDIEGLRAGGAVPGPMPAPKGAVRK